MTNACLLYPHNNYDSQSNPQVNQYHSRGQGTPPGMRGGGETYQEEGGGVVQCMENGYVQCNSKRGKITEFFFCMPKLKDPKDDVRSRLVELENDQVGGSSGPNGKSTVVTWKRIMDPKTYGKKSASSDQILRKTSKKKIKKKTSGGARSSNGREPKKQGALTKTDSSQLKLGHYWGSRGNGNSHGN